MKPSSVAVLSLLSLVVVGLPAQVPEGWVVFSRLAASSPLAVVSPRGNSAPVAIQNVPSELQWVPGVNNGISAVAIHPDGSLLVGNSPRVGLSVMVLYALQLNGTSVASFERYEIGLSAVTTGQVSAIEVLPDGRVLFSIGGQLPGGPLGSDSIGILDRANGSITSVPTPGVVGTFNALAVSPDAAFVYAGLLNLPGSATVIRVPFPAGGATTVATLPASIGALQFDNDGTLLAGLLNNFGDSIGTVDPVSGAYAPLPNAPLHTNAIAVERATGELLLAAFTSGYEIRRRNAAGVYSTVTAGGGTVSGVDVQDSPRRYGVGSPGASAYSWQVAPSATGLPELGNASFALEAVADPPIANVSVLAVSTARAQIAVLSVDLLVAPTNAVTAGFVSGASVSFALPIPNTASLAGTVFHAQSLHFEGGSWAASDGVTFGVVVP